MSDKNVIKSNPSLSIPTEVDEETMKALVDLMYTTRLAQNFLND